MKNNRSSKRKGFTLVELLIVIVVIGILSAMMMLSSTEAVSSAKASNIVSNLRNMKTAALAFFVDHIDSYDKTTVTENISSHKDDIMKYMSNSNSDYSDYSFSGTVVNTWYVSCDVKDSGVLGKLRGRASSVGLNIGKDQVGMFIR